MRSSARAPKDLNSDQNVMSIRQVIPMTGYHPIAYVNRGINMIERSLATVHKLPPSMLKKRPRYTIEPKLEQAVDEYFNDIVLPRVKLTDQETTAYKQLKKVAGLAYRGLNQLPLQDNQADRAYKTISAQYEAMQKQSANVPQSMQSADAIANIVGLGEVGHFLEYLNTNGVPKQEVQDVMTKGMSGKMLALLAGYRNAVLAPDLKLIDMRIQDDLKKAEVAEEQKVEPVLTPETNRFFDQLDQQVEQVQESIVDPNTSEQIYVDPKPFAQLKRPAYIPMEEWSQLRIATDNGTKSLPEIQNKWFQFPAIRRALQYKKLILGGVGLSLAAGALYYTYSQMPEDQRSVMNLPSYIFDQASNQLASMGNSFYDIVQPSLGLKPRFENGADFIEGADQGVKATEVIGDILAQAVQKNPEIGQSLQNIADGSRGMIGNLFKQFLPAEYYDNTIDRISKLIADGMSSEELSSLTSQIQQKFMNDATLGHIKNAPGLWNKEAWLPQMQKGISDWVAKTISETGQQFSDPGALGDTLVKTLTGALKTMSEKYGLDVPEVLRDPGWMESIGVGPKFQEAFAQLIQGVYSSAQTFRYGLQAFTQPQIVENWTNLLGYAAQSATVLGKTAYQGLSLFNYTMPSVKWALVMPILKYHNTIPIPEKVANMLAGQLKAPPERIREIMSGNMEEVKQEYIGDPAFEGALADITAFIARGENMHTAVLKKYGPVAAAQIQMQIRLAQYKFAREYLGPQKQREYRNSLIKGLHIVSKVASGIGSIGVEFEKYGLKGLIKAIDFGSNVALPIAGPVLWKLTKRLGSGAVTMAGNQLSRIKSRRGDPQKAEDKDLAEFQLELQKERKKNPQLNEQLSQIEQDYIEEIAKIDEDYVGLEESKGDKMWEQIDPSIAQAVEESKSDQSAPLQNIPEPPVAQPIQKVIEEAKAQGEAPQVQQMLVHQEVPKIIQEEMKIKSNEEDEDLNQSFQTAYGGGLSQTSRKTFGGIQPILYKLGNKEGREQYVKSIYAKHAEKQKAKNANQHTIDAMDAAIRQMKQQQLKYQQHARQMDEMSGKAREDIFGQPGGTRLV